MSATAATHTHSSFHDDRLVRLILQAIHDLASGIAESGTQSPAHIRALALLWAAHDELDRK